uniref:Si:ch211-250m6.12 n=1 Tax=Latimeria chalumnae TaxID=7897 RepID=H2ZZH0_LATCH
NRICKKILELSDSMQKGPPEILTLKLQKEKLDTKGILFRHSFGKENVKCSMKTIIVLGATGAGKTTLINGMINYILGVEWKDEFRFKLIKEENKTQAERQTSTITAYKIYHQEGFAVPYSLTIIDTPGFGDTKGIASDKFVTDKIRELFSMPGGIDEINAVCFVVQSALARLTHSQKYIFDSIFSIFGSDIKENIQVLVTFADGQKPPVLEAINISNIPCPKDENGIPIYFKFNNSAFFANNTEAESQVDDNFDKMFWNMGLKSMDKFFKALGNLETKSLTLTKQVLEERKRLEIAVQGLLPQIKIVLQKLDEISMTKAALKEHEDIMDENKDFQYVVEVPKIVKTDISGKKEFVTNCLTCNYTCHYPCTISEDAFKKWCAAMGGDDRNCTVCSGKCPWNVHHNMSFKIDYTTIKEEGTYQKLKVKYEKACGEKMTTEKIVQELEVELVVCETVVMELLEISSKCILQLEQIALRPHPLSTPEYIDLLIQSEKDEGKPGFLARIESLKIVKEQA